MAKNGDYGDNKESWIKKQPEPILKTMWESLKNQTYVGAAIVRALKKPIVFGLGISNVYASHGLEVLQWMTSANNCAELKYSTNMY